MSEVKEFRCSTHGHFESLEAKCPMKNCDGDVSEHIPLDVLHSYKCSEHGYFDAFSAECPMKGCTGEVFKVFLQPPGLLGEKTKFNDKTLKNLASDYGMTDIKSTREGEHQSGYLTRNNKKPPKGQAGITTQWGNNGGPLSSLAGRRYQSVAGEPVGFSPNQVGSLTGPSVKSYRDK